MCVNFIHVKAEGGIAETAVPSPGFCVYKGVQHSQGERWEDGCDYNCVCEDAIIGKYTCDEK